MRNNHHVSTGILILSLIGMTGCQSFTVPALSPKKLMFWKKDEIPNGSSARKIVALWTESVSYGAGQQATRGLGGRLYFYDNQNKPMKIDGDLVVYGFDDHEENDVEELDPQPDRRFVIAAEDFQQHYSESDFGPSYSVWIPWDAVGNDRKSISLVPMFKSKSGQVLVGEYSRSLLSGAKGDLRKKTTTYELNSSRNKPATDIQQVSFDEKTRMQEKQKGITKTSISLPPSMQRRIVANAWRTQNEINDARSAPTMDQSSAGARSFAAPVNLKERSPNHLVRKQLTRPRPRLFPVREEPAR